MSGTTTALWKNSPGLGAPTPGFKEAFELTERATPDAAKAEAVRDLWEAELALESAGTSQTPEEARLATLMQETPIPIISRPPERTWIWSDLHLADRSVLAAWNRPFRSTMGTVWVHELPQPKCHWDSNGLCRVLNPQTGR